MVPTDPTATAAQPPHSEALLAALDKQGAHKIAWCYLTTAELHRLDVAVTPLRRMGTMGVYLVGSVNERPDFRDVDVRMILRDDDFDARFGGDPFLWEAFCYAWSRTLSDDSRLRVDFQVQRMTEANENHYGCRHPLTGGVRPFAGRGDATSFAAAEVAVATE